MYFFAVPAVSMILLIYILGSLHILRWGTREKRSDYVLDDDKLSLLDRYSLHFIINFHSNLEIYIKSTKAFNIRVFFSRCCGRQRDERGKYCFNFISPCTNKYQKAKMTS